MRGKCIRQRTVSAMFDPTPKHTGQSTNQIVKVAPPPVPMDHKPDRKSGPWVPGTPPRCRAPPSSPVSRARRSTLMRSRPGPGPWPQQPCDVSASVWEKHVMFLRVWGETLDVSACVWDNRDSLWSVPGNMGLSTVCHRPGRRGPENLLLVAPADGKLISQTHMTPAF